MPLEAADRQGTGSLADSRKVQCPEIQGETRRGCAAHRILLTLHRGLETAEDTMEEHGTAGREKAEDSALAVL